MARKAQKKVAILWITGFAFDFGFLLVSYLMLCFGFIKAMKIAKKLKTPTVSGYSNDSNPFGDTNLNEK